MYISFLLPANMKEEAEFTLPPSTIKNLDKMNKRTVSWHWALGNGRQWWLREREQNETYDFPGVFLWGTFRLQCKEGQIRRKTTNPPSWRDEAESLWRAKKLEFTDRVPLRREVQKDHQRSSKEPPICFLTYWLLFVCEKTTWAQQGKTPERIREKVPWTHTRLGKNARTHQENWKTS